MPDPAKVPFAEAQKFTMPFGKHSGKTIDTIAMDDAGLLYLDWLFGEMSKESQGGIKAHTFDSLKVYLSDDSIKKEIQEAQRNKRR